MLCTPILLKPLRNHMNGYCYHFIRDEETSAQYGKIINPLNQVVV